MTEKAENKMAEEEENEAEKREMTVLFDNFEKRDIADDFELLAEEIKEAKTIGELKKIREEGVPDITARLDEFLERLEED